MADLIVLLIALLAIAHGYLLTGLVVERASFPARLAAGAVVGLALLAWLGLLAALAGGLNRATIAATVALLAAGTLALARAVPRDRVSLSGLFADRWGVAYYAAWALLLTWLFGRVMSFDAGGMRTAPANNYGDLPFHLSVITSFAFGENLPPESPIFAGMKFTYPFLIDFLTAFFARAGAGWPAAFFVENLTLALALVGLVEVMTRRLTGDRLAARLAPVIFFFNGGFGFLNFFGDLSQAPAGWLRMLTGLPGTYTINAELMLGATVVPLRWGNIFTTLLIPQRSLLFGLPFAALIVTLWWMALGGEAGARERRRYLLAAGALAGLLPMLHAHGFLAVMLAGGAMALLFWSRDWAAFFLPAMTLAAPQALWLSGTQVRGRLFEPHWGWEADDAPVLLFWAANAGVFILLLAIALLGRSLIPARLRRFYLPFALWFVVPNLVLLAPWAWDNIKMLVYWHLASCPLAAAVLAACRRGGARRAAGALALVALTLAGALDVVRALSPVENLALYDAADLRVAALLRERTPPRAVIIHAPIHNSVVTLTGRQSFMGYPGHLWTHGIDYEGREAEVTEIYRGGPRAAELLRRHGVDYVVIGPSERARLAPDEAFFARYPLIVDEAGYRVYGVGN